MLSNEATSERNQRDCLRWTSIGKKTIPWIKSEEKLADNGSSQSTSRKVGRIHF